MGTSIELCIGGVSLAYAKNHMGEDFGFLFQKGDLFRRKSDAINYEYFEEHPEEKEQLVEAEEIFVRTLARTVPRLQLLGITLESARLEYEAVVEEAQEISSYDELDESKNEYLSFAEFCELACRFPLSDLESGYIEYDTPNRDIVAQGRFTADANLFERIPQTDNFDSFWSEVSFLSARVCILSAGSMIQIFALNSANAEVEVTWGFGPIVHAGWVQREAFQPEALQKQRILIATEGASDARIIRRSLDALRPEVADFFNFVDVDERHHFWGTGNLVKFAEGLLRIEIINKILFVLDNDAEGVDAFRKLQNLKLPVNLRAMLLPDQDDFQEFRTSGPEGVNLSNINGRAAAIECYLDLRLANYPEAQVTWSSYKKDVDAWHGALDFKESYAKYYYEQSVDRLRDGDYDVSKLLKLTDVLIQQAGLVEPVV